MEVKKVLEQEKVFQFDTFNHDLALKITQKINELVKAKYDKPVGVKIFYQNLTVVHFLMNGRKESPWLDRKVKTVLDSGHSSLYVYVSNEINGNFSEWLEDPKYAICGGGFPIIEKGVLKGAICVSGLHHLEDHEVIIAALAEIMNKSVNIAN